MKEARSTIPVREDEEPAPTLSGRPVNEPLEAPPAEAPGREQVEGTCLGKAHVNPRIIHVAIPGRVDPIAVFVRDPSNFIKGMKVRAYRDTSPGNTPQWFLNSPLPRFKGRY